MHIYTSFFHSMFENTYILKCCHLVYVQQCNTSQSFQGDCGLKRMRFPHNLLAALANNVCLSRITNQPQGPVFLIRIPSFQSGFRLFSQDSFLISLKDYKDLKYKVGEVCLTSHLTVTAYLQSHTFLRHGNSLKSYTIQKHKRQFNPKSRMQSSNSHAYFL